MAFIPVIAASKAPYAAKDTEMSSILTNTSSMVALQTLKGINKNVAKVQDEISTGKAVATAKDNSSAWSIASTMSSDISTYKTLGKAMSSASAMVGTARTAAEQISSLMTDIQTIATQAIQPDADVTKLQADVDGKLANIASIAAAAQYNGINLVKATPATATVTTSVIRDAAGALTVGAFDVAGVDLSTFGTTAISLTTTDAASKSTLLNSIDTKLDSINTAAATFGAAQARIEAEADFLSKQADSLKNGVGALVDADMEEASARLSALQTQQQLGIQALTIANSAPQNVLSLFR